MGTFLGRYDIKQARGLGEQGKKPDQVIGAAVEFQFPGFCSLANGRISCEDMDIKIMGQLQRSIGIWVRRGLVVMKNGVLQS